MADREGEKGGGSVVGEIGYVADWFDMASSV